MVFPLIPLSCLTPFVLRESVLSKYSAASPFGSTATSLAQALICRGIDDGCPECER